MVNITHVNVLSLASSLPYADKLHSITQASEDYVSFFSYHDSFLAHVLGPNASQELVTQESWEAFHEAGVYSHATGKLYASSNWQFDLDNPINVTTIDLIHNDEIESIRFDNVTNPAGAAAFYPVGSPADSSQGQQIVFCDQGDFVEPARLVLVDPSTNHSRVLIDNFLGRNFSSLDDVKQHYHTGDLWFSDPRYGYWQYYRPEPVIRPQVYRFEPETGVVQVVADGFIAPNGVEFSPDFKHLYITDTGISTFPGKINMTDPATIYRYDVSPDGRHIGNRQVFAYPDAPAPDGIHTDTEGNVYSGCGDGINVWNPQGTLIGKFVVASIVANFAFVPGGIYMFNEEKLFKIKLKAEGREVRRDFALE